MELRVLTVPLGMLSAMGLSVSVALQVAEPSVPLLVTPTVSLVAIIGGAISMGMLFSRVKQLERDTLELKNDLKKFMLTR